MEEFHYDDESFRDSIATVDEKGKRKWIFPKKPKGRFYNARTILSIFLLIFFFGAPFLKVNGEQFLMLNVLERKFVIFGLVFMPQDFFLFAIAMLTLVVFIVLFTVVFGRLFCGWICPQTIFLEMVFRKIEYFIEGDAPAQRKLDRMAWNQEKILKKGGKWIIFYVISFLISNMFLSYVMGSDRVIAMVKEGPSDHLGVFVPLIVFSGVFFFVFAWFREQACTTVCPYGRLQGVLLDKDSIVVAYDYQRGEPRERVRKGVQRGGGDCIACGLCVQVCPTGIDIKDGTQLECVNCTACIDACDEVMDKVGFKRGLIRYASENMIAKGIKFHWTPKALAYSVVLLVLVAIMGFSLAGRTELKTTVLRTRGVLYQKVGQDTIMNVYDVQIMNKRRETIPVSLKVESPEGSVLHMVGKELELQPVALTSGKFLLKIPRDQLEGYKTKVVIGVYDKEGQQVDKTNTVFLGPM